MTKVKKSSILLTCLLLALLCGLLFYIDGNASKYIIRITRLCAINIVLALSMNLVNGFTGIFSLGHAGFMAIGAYTVALLTIPVAKKETIFMLEPLIAPLNTLTLPFGAALIIGGLLAAALAFLIGLPCLRLRGDYLGHRNARIFGNHPYRHHQRPEPDQRRSGSQIHPRDGKHLVVLRRRAGDHRLYRPADFLQLWPRIQSHPRG